MPERFNPASTTVMPVIEGCMLTNLLKNATGDEENSEKTQCMRSRKSDALWLRNRHRMHVHELAREKAVGGKENSEKTRCMGSGKSDTLWLCNRCRMHGACAQTHSRRGPVTRRTQRRCSAWGVESQTCYGYAIATGCMHTNLLEKATGDEENSGKTWRMRSRKSDALWLHNRRRMHVHELTHEKAAGGEENSEKTRCMRSGKSDALRLRNRRSRETLLTEMHFICSYHGQFRLTLMYQNVFKDAMQAVGNVMGLINSIITADRTSLSCLKTSLLDEDEGSDIESSFFDEEYRSADNEPDGRQEHQDPLIMPEDNATIEDFRATNVFGQALRDLQLRYVSLQQQMQKLKAHNTQLKIKCSKRGAHANRDTQSKVVVKYDTNIRALGRCFGVTVWSWVPPAAWSYTEHPAIDPGDADQFTNQTTRVMALSAEMFDFLDFQAAFNFGVGQGKATTIGNVRLSAGEIFGLPQEWFSSTYDRASNLDLQRLLKGNGDKYLLLTPVLFPAEVSQIIKIALFGRNALHSGRRSGPKTSGENWQITSTTPHMVAWAANLVDTQYNPKGARSGIDYLGNFDRYLQLLLSLDLARLKSLLAFLNVLIFSDKASVVHNETEDDTDLDVIAQEMNACAITMTRNPVPVAPLTHTTVTDEHGSFFTNTITRTMALAHTVSPHAAINYVAAIPRARSVPDHHATAVEADPAAHTPFTSAMRPHLSHPQMETPLTVVQTLSLAPGSSSHVNYPGTESTVEQQLPTAFQKLNVQDSIVQMPRAGAEVKMNLPK
ncbi:uncharacterized protein LAESUDRAFT_713201 [Laetiporus sulphureus 93-53]|uniref:Uncharacterized protein n=1 Tax=Laetiporus sulphureus 93-53 TaxID=1314785 RepID=A0A165EVS0_9APHY|nr:uncharacterized protein LAESUDRAFT_713201 [Laetiporus sulphureus 93-53]KZT07867.1 hypothetical protein LAESUDRAFT_713201 [Laetiporus sulphureus 93-53]